jgi:hypothetical protein
MSASSAHTLLPQVTVCLTVSRAWWADSRGRNPYGPFHTRPVVIMLIRTPDRSDGFDVALASTDTKAATAELIAGYDRRWTIETAHQEAKAHGVGQARNRVRRAVERTVRFAFLARRSRSPGTRCTATPRPTSTRAAGPPRGTARRRPSATQTCSPRCAAS